MALHFDYALRLRSNSVKTPGLYGYAGVVVHRSASLASMYSFFVGMESALKGALCFINKHNHLAL
ncbi:MAG: hypothetical protein FJ190_12605 [Gammaproteobacteria bacterium]|nr:hypothetical protein [Gammaproteobacteria bacterium]